jgi:hypothetical protein
LWIKRPDPPLIFVIACHCRDERRERLQYPNRALVMLEHFGQATVSHRAFVQISTGNNYAAPL